MSWMRGSRGCSPDSDGLRRARERRRADARTLADCRSVGPEGAVGPMGLRRISATHASLRGIGAALVLVSLAYLGTRAALPFMRGEILPARVPGPAISHLRRLLVSP